MEEYVHKSWCESWVTVQFIFSNMLHISSMNIQPPAAIGHQLTSHSEALESQGAQTNTHTQSLFLVVNLYNSGNDAKRIFQCYATVKLLFATTLPKLKLLDQPLKVARANDS